MFETMMAMFGIPAPTDSTNTVGRQDSRLEKIEEVVLRPTKIDLPPELICRIIDMCGYRKWAVTWAFVCKEFSTYDWYDRAVHPLTLFPSKRCKTLHDAISHAAVDGCLLIKPGVYRESLRIGINMVVIGIGPPGSVVLEAPGWEECVYFAGLGKWRNNTG